MKTKLTLSVNKDILGRAKKLSLKRGQSLSKLFEEYLEILLKQEQIHTKKYSITEELSGILNEQEVEYKTSKVKHLLKKHA
ncbi:MAG: hypothetical protein H7296_13160 [Bacteroidia bacterium]|nr:hypothetical protein [Bacteroidia bacterium]